MAYNELVDRSPVGGVATSVITLVASNPNRRLLVVQNNSGVYMGMAPHGTTPSVNASGIGGAGTIVLAPGGGMVFDTAPIPTNTFDVIAESGTGNIVTVQEM